MKTSFLVTGAAGCIGQAVMERLDTVGAKSVGLDIVLPPGGGRTGKWVRGDILAPDIYAGVLRGIDIVIHLAAKVHCFPRTAEEADRFWKVNLDGTKRLIEAAAKEGIRRFVYVSTVGVISTVSDDLKDAYVQSKSAAEKAVLEYRDRIEVVIVRPATVYGPHDKGNIFKLVRWVEKGLPPIIGPGTNRKSVVFVRTLADALLFLAERGEKGNAYVVTDGRDLTMNEIVDVICYVIDKKNRWPAIPLSLARGMAAVNEWLSDKVEFPRLLEREAVEKLAEETVFDPTPLFSLGFSPMYSFEEGIAETVRWYKGLAL